MSTLVGDLYKRCVSPGDEDEETAPAEPRLIFGDCYQPMVGKWGGLGRVDAVKKKSL